MPCLVSLGSPSTNGCNQTDSKHPKQGQPLDRFNDTRVHGSIGMAGSQRRNWLGKNSRHFSGFVGVLLVVSDGNLSSISIGTFGAPGDVLILISAVNGSVFSVLSRRGLRSYPASLMMFYVMTFGWIFTSVLFFGETELGEVTQLTFNGWVGIAFLGIFCSGLAYIAWYDALKELTAAQSGVFLYIEPLVAVIVAFFVLGEAFSATSLFGGGAILFGVWLVNRV